MVDDVDPLMLPINELDEAWALALADAEARARAAGRKDIAEYLALRSANDLTRKVGCDWLLTAFSMAADEANRAGAGIQVSQEDGHRFKVGHASMVGKLLHLRRGVRTLFVEVGWPRTPPDGFIREGGLACGNIKHLGMTAASEQLKLILGPGGAPRWTVQGKRGPRPEIHESNIRKHIAILLEDSRKHSRSS
jgi:hypothetical protein